MLVLVYFDDCDVKWEEMRVDEEDIRATACASGCNGRIREGIEEG